jgi:putative phosphoesterase
MFLSIEASQIPETHDPLVTLGVIADTHVPDRYRKIPGKILELFRAAGVTRILHAGDISIPSVLAELSQVAPVTAVRGNRDWALRSTLPVKTTLSVAGLSVGLTHGHGGWIPYFLDKLAYIPNGYQFERYYRLLLRDFPRAQVIVYGHTHFPENRWENGQLVFNPGSACCPAHAARVPSIGFLRFYGGQKVVGEIVEIE